MELFGARGPIRPRAVRFVGSWIAKMEQVVESSPSEFVARYHVLLRTVLDAPSLEFFYHYALTRAASGTMTLADTQAPGTPSATHTIGPGKA